MSNFRSLRAKLLVFVFLIGGLSLAGTAALYWGIQANRAGGTVINLAGAQRMLSQKMSKEALLAVSGQGKPAALRESRDRFDRVLRGLISGDAELELAPSGSAEIRTQLQVVSALWTPFREAIDSIAEKPAKNARIQDVVRSNPELLKQMNQAVVMLEADAKSKVDRLLKMQTGLFVAMMLLLVAGWMLLLRPLLRHITRAVDKLDTTAEVVYRSAEVLAQSSDSLADASSQQAAAIHQTSTAAHGIGDTAARTKEQCLEAMGLLSRSEREFSEASERLHDVVQATQEISASTQKIASINKVIETIAFQTNILALNAAVEAARAGEAGMGFSVVADEVRQLAQRSSEASRNTSELIGNSVAVVGVGADRVEKAADSMRTIQADWEQVRDLATQSNHASEQQSASVIQIGQAIALMESNTQRSSAMAQENAASAGVLRSKAESMLQLAGALSEVVRGRSGRA